MTEEDYKEEAARHKQEGFEIIKAGFGLVLVGIFLMFFLMLVYAAL